jgi:hypothetical protein
MGNRCVITTEAREIGVYLHYNGDPDFVASLLWFCKLAKFREPENDCYGWARLCQVAANYFGGTLSIGIDRYEKLDTDNWDNGTYIIRDWKILAREFTEETYLGTVNMKTVLEIYMAQQESMLEGGNTHG